MAGIEGNDRESGQNFPPPMPPDDAAPASPRPAPRVDGSVDPPRPSFAEFRAAAAVRHPGSAPPRTSPTTVVRDGDRQAILLTLMEAGGAVPLGDMSKESRFARMENVLIKQAFTKLKNERPCDFPDSVNLDTVERELLKIKGSIAVDRVNEAKLLIRDKSEPMWSVIFDLWDERTQTWKSGLQLPEVFDRILAALWDRDEALRVSKLPESAAAGKKVIRSWNDGRPQPKWFLGFRRYWFPRYGRFPATWCKSNKGGAAAGGSAEPAAKVMSRTSSRDAEKVRKEQEKADARIKYGIVKSDVWGGQDATMLLGTLSGVKRSIDESIIQGRYSSAASELGPLDELIFKTETQLTHFEFGAVAVPRPVLDEMRVTLEVHKANRASLKLRIEAIGDEIEAFRRNRTPPPSALQNERLDAENAAVFGPVGNAAVFGPHRLPAPSQGLSCPPRTRLSGAYS